MAFKLSIVSGTVFKGPIGEEVTLALQSPSGVSAEIDHIRYAKKEIDVESPFQFTIKRGSKGLVVLVEASKPGARLKLVEVDGQVKQVLHEFHFDPQNPARGYTIVGEIEPSEEDE